MGVTGQKTPEMNVSRAAHIRSSQVYRPTPSRLREIAFQSLRKNGKFCVNFVTVFNSLVLRASMELDKKLGHFEYLLLEKRSFPGSFVL